MIQAQPVNRARILMLKADGISIDDIANKKGMNRKSAMLCLNKYLGGGVENVLFDTPDRGRNAEITDEEKAWIINIAFQKPVNLGYSTEVWILLNRTRSSIDFQMARYYYPFVDNLQGKKIVIYGAGIVGKDFYSQICRYNGLPSG